MVHFLGPMVVLMKESSRTIIFMVKESTDGETGEHMKESGLIIKCMVMECLLGQMAESMRVNTLMTRKKVREPLHGLMEEYILEAGLMANNMVLVNILLLKESTREVNGKRERE
jgi:hypothetical protein